MTKKITSDKTRFRIMELISDADGALEDILQYKSEPAVMHLAVIVCRLLEAIRHEAEE